MTRDVLEKISKAIKAVITAGHGSVEIIIQDGKVLDIVKKERERVS